MSEFDKNMSAILETEFVEVEQKEPDAQPVVAAPAPQTDAAEDFDYSRKTYHDLLEKGGLALDGILEVAKESQHPRAYEVAATMMKNLADMTDKLMILQKQRKDLQGPSDAEKPTQVNVDKAVFVGSATDLLKKIKNGNN